MAWSNSLFGSEGTTCELRVYLGAPINDVMHIANLCTNETAETLRVTTKFHKKIRSLLLAE